MSGTSLSAAIYELNNETASIDDKIVALRFLKRHLGFNDRSNSIHYRNLKGKSKGVDLQSIAYKYQEDSNEEVGNFLNRTDGVETADNLSFFNRKRINQLVLNNVLKIILTVDNTMSGHKKQLIRTELFVILASLMQSTTLFGDIANNIDETSDLNETMMEESSFGEGGSITMEESVQVKTNSL